jgi:hypothetical protein
VTFTKSCAHHNISCRQWQDCLVRLGTIVGNLHMHTTRIPHIHHTHVPSMSQ